MEVVDKKESVEMVPIFPLFLHGGWGGAEKKKTGGKAITVLAG